MHVLLASTCFCSLCYKSSNVSLKLSSRFKAINDELNLLGRVSNTVHMADRDVLFGLIQQLVH